MRLADVRNVLQARALTDDACRELSVDGACGADLMSDVLAFTHSGILLLTGLTHPQVVRTAEVAGISAIVFVRDKTPSEETVTLAQERGIPLLQTKFTLFEACGRLYAAGLQSCDVDAKNGVPRGRESAVALTATNLVSESQEQRPEHGR